MSAKHSGNARIEYTELCEGLAFWFEDLDRDTIKVCVEGDGVVLIRTAKHGEGKEELKKMIKHMCHELGFCDNSCTADHRTKIRDDI